MPQARCGAGAEATASGENGLQLLVLSGGAAKTKRKRAYEHVDKNTNSTPITKEEVRTHSCGVVSSHLTQASRISPSALQFIAA